MKLLKFWFNGLLFDSVSLFYLLSPYILLEILPIKKIQHSNLINKIKSLIFSFNLTIGIFLNLYDIISLKFNLRRTSYSMLSEYTNENGKITFIINFVKTNLTLSLLFIFVLCIVLFFTLATYKISKNNTKNNFSYKKKIAFFILSIPTLILAARGGLERRPISITTSNRYCSKPMQSILILNTPFVIFKTIGKTSIKRIKYFDKKNEYKYFNPHIEYKSKQKNQKNIVFFIMESFSKEFIGALNKDRKNFVSYTPFLDSLIPYSLTFKYSYANGRKSLDALPSCFASIPELGLHYSFSQYSTNKVNALGNILKKLGYNTMFFHGGSNGTMQFDSYSKICGFDKYYGRKEYNNDNDFDGVWGIWDENFFKYSAKKISESKQPFIAAIYSLSSHHPYNIPKKYKNKFSEGKIPLHKAIRYSDYSLKQFFNIAKTKPWYKNTIFVITSDHVAAAKYRKDYKTDYGYFSVPIIFFSPDSSLKKYDKNTVAQQIDITPTILYLLGYNKKIFSLGKNLLKPRYNYAIFYLNNQYLIIDTKYLLTFNGEKTKAIFNIKNDPMLKHNIQDSIQNKKNELFLKAFIQQYNNRIIENRLSI